MLLTALALALAAPSAEAEALGRRLAETGTLASLLPTMIAKETDELVEAHPELSEAEKAELRSVAAATGEAGSERLLAATGRAYAEALSVEDLRMLVAFHESPPARRRAAAEPQVIAATMGQMGEMDFKKDVMAAFCAKTGKGCEAD